jgi:surface protein
MSILKVTGIGIKIVPAATAPAPAPQTYVRSPSWPACEADSGDNRMRGLYAVWPQGGNFFAARAIGSYNINFGDGTSTNYASNVVAYYEYDYANAALDGTNAPVTFTASTNTVNRTAHGYTDGMQVRFYDIATTTGIQEATPYYVTNATSNTFKISYNNYNSFGVAREETAPQSLTFKPDGTKMYVMGTTGDDVNEYDLSTAWDVSTAIFLQLFSVAAQETIPTGLFFKPDGTKMYVIGQTGDDVNEYDLGTAWDVSTASFLQTYNGTATETNPTAIFFKPDGTKMYVIGTTGDAIREYDLSTAWNVSTASFLQTFSVLAQESAPTGLFFKPDGTKMYVMGSAGDDVNEYDLSTAWDVSTASYLQSFVVGATSPTGLFFKPDGTKMYVMGTTSDTINAYDLSTAWDVSTAIVSAIQSNIVDFTNDGSAVLLPYKIATVTISPQAGQSITTFDLFEKHNQAGLVTNYATGWLDMAIALPDVTALNIGQASSSINYGLCERVRINQLGNVTNYSNLFYGFTGLKNVVIPDNITTVTTTSSMFFNCYSLYEVPLFDTSNVTNVTNMFYNCNTLVSIPFFDTSSVTGINSMFQFCSSITTVPAFDTSNVTNMTSMFNGCLSLTSVPFFDTTNVTLMSNMFNNCYSLASVPFFDTTNVTNMIAMFSGCHTLTSVPFFDTSNVTSMGSMFSYCTSLTTVPLFDTSKVTSMGGMFQYCYSLASVPFFDTSNVTSMGSMFYDCRSITTVPLFNTRRVSSMSSMFQNCYSLRSVPFFETSTVNAMSGMFSGCSSLTTVPQFNTTAVTNMTLMFSVCSSLESVPKFDTSVVSSMASMFAGCRSLIFVPAFDTSNVTSMASMFNACSDIVRIPAFNTSLVTNFSAMFTGCTTLVEVPEFDMSTPTSASGYSTTFSTCTSLSRIRATGIRFTFTLASLKLSATALNEIYTNLPTVTGQTITVSGNYGTTGDDPTIATAKGWTVTG